MASVNSPIRKLIKPLLYKIFGRKGYMRVQCKAKIRDISHRLVEEKEMVLLPEFVKENQSVIDLGANYAYYVERLSKLVGDKGKVYAFEPIPFTHDVCKMIIGKLKLSNVELYKYAAHDKQEKLSFRVPKLDFGGISAGQSHLADRNNEMEGKENYYSFNDEEIVECEGVNLDAFLGKKLDNLSFVKIDIEGGEYFALKGLVKTIKKFNPVILVEIQPFFLKGMNILESELKELIYSLDYEIYHFNEKTKKLKLCEGDLWDDNYFLLSRSKKEEYFKLIE